MACPPAVAASWRVGTAPPLLAHAKPVLEVPVLEDVADAAANPAGPLADAFAEPLAGGTDDVQAVPAESKPPRMPCLRSVHNIVLAFGGLHRAGIDAAARSSEPGVGAPNLRDTRHIWVRTQREGAAAHLRGTQGGNSDGPEVGEDRVAQYLPCIVLESPAYHTHSKAVLPAHRTEHTAAEALFPSPLRRPWMFRRFKRALNIVSDQTTLDKGTN